MATQERVLRGCARAVTAGAVTMLILAGTSRCGGGSDKGAASDAKGPPGATSSDGGNLANPSVLPESGPVSESDAEASGDASADGLPDGSLPASAEGGTPASEGGSGSRDGAAPGKLSGLPWSSGVESNFTSEQTAWGTFRGRPTDVAQVYAGRDSWSNLTQPGYVFSNMSGYAGRIVLSVSPYPESLGQSAMSTCAAGTYDSY